MSIFFAALRRAEQERVQRRPVELSEVASEQSPLFAAESRKGLEQLKLLLDYTKFDISLYTTVAIIFSAAIAFEPGVFRLHRGLMGLAVVFTSLAGMAAGIIASRCARFTSRGDLWKAKIGPFGWRCVKGEYWEYVQHACFGIALVAAVLSVLGGYIGQSWTH
jgi:hypothetical protein